MKNDLLLIERFKAGDESAFNELVQAHMEWVTNFIMKVIKHREDAQDLAQDVFVKIYFNLKKFRGDSEFKTWVYKIVVNQMNNYFKKQKLLSWFQNDYDENDVSNFRNQNDKDDQVKLIIGVKRLAKMQRNVVLLRIFQDMSFKDISEVLSISENSAKVSFYKAKQNLKRIDL